MNDEVYDISSDPHLREQIERNEKLNTRLTQSTVTLIGDKSTIKEVVQLLSYIRNAVRNNLDTTISVDIGKYVINTEFNFDVDGQQIPDLKIPPSWNIN